MSQIIVYQDNARKSLEQGMSILSQVVSITLGPKGRNVVLEKKLAVPCIVNDGITIAKEIELQDVIQNTGVALIRQAAEKTNDIAGDGTTTATILSYAIVKQGLRNIAVGSNPVLLKKGIDKAMKFLISKIGEYARPITNISEIEKVASISSGNDSEIGSIIAKAIERVGHEGVISLEEGQSTFTRLEIKEGMKFEKGFISPYFVTDSSKMEAVYDNVYILLTDQKITLIQQELVPILEQVSKTGKPLLIIADDIEKEALATIIINKLRGIVQIVAVRAPGFGDRRKSWLQDIAILTSGQLITQDLGLTLDNLSLQQLGVAKKIYVNQESTTIIAYSDNLDIKFRCDEIRRQLEISNNKYEKEKLQERLAKLMGGVAVITVGAATEIEMKNKKLRLEDAINATRAAIEEGILPGGGSALVHLSQDLARWSKSNLSIQKEELLGTLMIQKALLFPISKIIENAGKNSCLIIEKIKQCKFSLGYDVNQNSIVDMYDAGILDPAKVTRSALQNSVSIASMILTTECIIADNNSSR